MAAHLIRRRLLGLLAAAAVAACAGSPVPANNAGTVTLFLVRHAEKDKSDDPVLTSAGALRAIALAERLSGEGVTEIWSTQTRRTQSTAAPLASALGLPVQAYDAGDLSAFAAKLTATPGVKLVVGHSNTTGALAALIGAEAGPAIDEASEFDRLYVISVDAGGIVRSRIERYGAASVAAAEPAE